MGIPFLILINIVLILVGLFMEGGAAIIILSLTLLAAAQAVEIHRLHRSAGGGSAVRCLGDHGVSLLAGDENRPSRLIFT